MRDLSWMLLIAALAGCGPAVSVGESSTGDSSTGSGDEGSTAPPPSTMTTGTPPAGETGDPEACFVGQIRACTCPDGSPGERECGADRLLGPCQCGDSSSTGWSDSSSTDGVWPEIPELPPGEVCLPTTMPCAGDFAIGSDESLAALSICSRIEGGLFIEGNVTTVKPLECLVSVEGVLAIDSTQIMDLGALGIGLVEALVIINNTQLLSIDLPLINSIQHLVVVQNANLMDLQFGNLDTLQTLEFQDNPLLPDCLITDLIAQTFPEAVTCSGNLEAGCAEICG